MRPRGGGESLFGGHCHEPLGGLIVWGACQAAIEPDCGEARLGEETRQFRPRVEANTPGEHLLLWASHPNPVILDHAPALPDDTLFEQVFIAFGMPMPGAGLEIAGQRLFA